MPWRILRWNLDFRTNWSVMTPNSNRVNAEKQRGLLLHLLHKDSRYLPPRKNNSSLVQQISPGVAALLESFHDAEERFVMIWLTSQRSKDPLIFEAGVTCRAGSLECRRYETRIFSLKHISNVRLHKRLTSCIVSTTSAWIVGTSANPSIRASRVASASQSTARVYFFRTFATSPMWRQWFDCSFVRERTPTTFPSASWQKME